MSTDADTSAEMPKHSTRAGDCIAEGNAAAHQAHPVSESSSGDGKQKLIDEVLSRENLIAAKKKVCLEHWKCVCGACRRCHMNQALPTRYFRKLGLLSLIDEHQRLACST